MTELVVRAQRVDQIDATSARAAVRSRRALLGKGVAGLLGLLLLGGTVAPIAQNWRPEPKDDFPFSYYPMFSQRRDGLYKVNYMVGLDGQGNRQLISHAFAGKGGFNQTRRQINRLVREDKADTLCRAVAARVAREDDVPYPEIVTVRIVRGGFRFAQYFGGNKAPVKEDVHASCQIERGDQTARGQP